MSLDPKLARWYGYARVSTAGQRDHGVSLPVQRDSIESYVRARAGRDPDDIFVDGGRSAFRTPLDRRPDGGARLVAALRPGDQVVTHDLTRAFRNAPEAMTWHRAWAGRDIGLHIVNFGGNSLDATSAVGRAVFGVVAVFGEFDSAQKGEKIRDVKSWMRAQGLLTNGVAGWGFKPARRGKGKLASSIAVPDPEQRAIMAKLLEWREMGLALRQIRTHLIRHAIRNPRRPDRHPTETWHLNTIAQAIEAEKQLRDAESRSLTPDPEEAP